MLKTFGISGLLLSLVMAVAPPVASARDHDYDEPARMGTPERHEWRKHERWEQRHGYRYGYYDRYGYWHY